MDTTPERVATPRRTFGKKFFLTLIMLWVIFVVAVYVASAIRKAQGPPKNVTPNQAPAASPAAPASADGNEGGLPNQ